MPSSNEQLLIERIHATATPMVLAISGGGSGAIPALLQVPGASATVLEAVVPYAAAALRDWLGGPPDQACSERTARAMAMAAFARARLLSNANPHIIRGIGATASLATTRVKQGAHRIHIAWQSADRTVVTSCELEKGVESRLEEERIATQLVLSMVAEACGLEAMDEGSVLRHRSVKSISRREQHAKAEWSQLLLGERNTATSIEMAPLLFPGAFNPVHAGHEKMAAIAQDRYGQPVTWELSIRNVDKPPLDFVEINDRLAGLDGRLVVLTRAATFVEKAALAPGTTFVVGIDTIERIGDLRFYGNNSAMRDAAITAIAAHRCRFLVFGRLHGGSFRSLSDLEIMAELRSLCDEVPESQFRYDLASSAIRVGAQSPTNRRT